MDIPDVPHVITRKQHDFRATIVQNTQYKHEVWDLKAVVDFLSVVDIDEANLVVGSDLRELLARGCVDDEKVREAVKVAC